MVNQTDIIDYFDRNVSIGCANLVHASRKKRAPLLPVNREKHEDNFLPDKFVWRGDGDPPERKVLWEECLVCDVIGTVIRIKELK